MHYPVDRLMHTMAFAISVMGTGWNGKTPNDRSVEKFDPVAQASRASAVPTELYPTTRKEGRNVSFNGTLNSVYYDYIGVGDMVKNPINSHRIIQFSPLHGLIFSFSSNG